MRSVTENDMGFVGGCREKRLTQVSAAERSAVVSVLPAARCVSRGAIPLPRSGGRGGRAQLRAVLPGRGHAGAAQERAWARPFGVAAPAC